MDIQKELNAFKLVAQSKGWNIDGETTPTNFHFYCLTTKSGWEMWQEAKADAVPEGFVLVEVSELESLKSDNEYITQSCIEWTDRAYRQRAKLDLIKNKVEKLKQSGTSLDLESFINYLSEFCIFKHDSEFEGFVLVPREPTEEMIRAGYQSKDKTNNLIVNYKAMIEAQEPK